MIISLELDLHVMVVSSVYKSIFHINFTKLTEVVLLSEILQLVCCRSKGYSKCSQGTLEEFHCGSSVPKIYLVIFRVRETFTRNDGNPNPTSWKLQLNPQAGFSLTDLHSSE